MLGLRMRQPEVGTITSANCAHVRTSGFCDSDNVADLAYCACVKCCNERREIYIEPMYQWL